LGCFESSLKSFQKTRLLHLCSAETSKKECFFAVFAIVVRFLGLAKQLLYFKFPESSLLNGHWNVVSKTWRKSRRGVRSENSAVMDAIDRAFSP
jgi:hypothetical protein